MRIENEGMVNDPGDMVVRFYASTDTLITPSDIYLGDALASLSKGVPATATLYGILPTDVPQGSYYIGWIIDPSNWQAEANEDNNTGYKSTPRLRVVNPSQSVLYVDAQAQGADDGSTWATAFTSLQDALAVALPGREIRVARGVYTPDRGMGITRGNREASFVLAGGITIRGGYAGAGAPDPGARNIKTYVTILSGDLKSNDRPVADPCNLWQEASRTDNSRHVLATVLDKGETTLDGVQVTGGYAFGPSATAASAGDTQGAGLLMTGGSLTLSNCTFSDNWASGDGGAVYLADGSLESADCTFHANGAGLENRVGNSRGTGGALRSDGKSQMTLARCTFDDNFAGLQGGALDNDGGSVTLTWCRFLQNQAGTAGGGAIWNSAGRLNLAGCTFTGNRSRANGGALVNSYNGLLSAANCSWHANYSVVRAGAIYTFAGSKTTLWNCTLAANRQDGSRGGIVCGSGPGAAGGELTLANCILWNGGSEIANEDKSLVTVGRTNIQGGWPGLGNLNTDPLFLLPAGPDGIAGTEDDNLRLGPASLCVDRGDSTLLPQDFADLDGDGDLKEPLPLDLDGQERVAGPAVDLGAYEMQPASSSSAPVSACSTDN
jgi:hypothetical protein